MAELVPYAALAVAVVAIWAGAMAFLDVLTPADVRAWRRLARLRGFAGKQSWIELAAQRSFFLQRIQRELDLHRQLAIADQEFSPLVFVARIVLTGALALAVLLVVDAAARAALGAWPLPPWLVAIAALATIPLSVLELRRTAQRRQQQAGRTLGDMMMMVAVMTDSRGFQVDDAVRILSRCAVDTSLRDLLDRQGFRRLVTQNYRSTVEQYRLISEAYGIAEFSRIADAAATANVGIPERDVYTRLALSVCRDRLADARLHSARAKVLVTLPVAAMLIPLLLLIAAPTFAAISAGVQGG